MRAPVWLLALLGAAHSTSALRQPRINAAHKTSVRAAPGGDDAASLFAEAARLRREAAEAERDFAPATEATTEAPAARPGLSVVLPIARPDWSVEDTECFFEPRSDGSAQLIKFEVEVPCGVILQESDDAGGRPIVVVGAVGEGSNAEAAGLRRAPRPLLGIHVRRGDSCREVQEATKARRCSPFAEYWYHALAMRA